MIIFQCLENFKAQIGKASAVISPVLHGEVEQDKSQSISLVSSFISLWLLIFFMQKNAMYGGLSTDLQRL